MTTTHEEHLDGHGHDPHQILAPGHAHDHDEPPQFYGVTFGSGDFVSLFSLFFDNLSSLLGLAGAILALVPGNALLAEVS